MSALPDISTAQLPVAYSRAREELAKCWRVDECKTWADKAQALASYAKQADDKGLYEVALRIQARAIRRCGELLKEIEPAKNQHDASARACGGPSTRTQAASDAGLSQRQAKTALRVANVPEDEFEQAIESEAPPTVTALAERGTRKQEEPFYAKYGIVPDDFHVATHVWGEVNRFAELAGKTDQEQVARGLIQGEHEKTCANARVCVAWLTRLIEVLKCTS